MTIEARQTIQAIDGLSPAEMYERVIANDRTADGRFFVGVLTTGVYCRPSCTARKPLRGNVRFFAGVQEAKSAGLRPCRRCHPDDFADGIDVTAEEMAALIAEVRAQPARYPDVQSLVDRSGYGPTRLFEMFHETLEQTPAAFLRASRIARAQRALRDTDEPILAVALAAGFRSTSAFHHRFKEATGMTPSAYRRQNREKK